jgi:hypothetical protein
MIEITIRRLLPQMGLRGAVSVSRKLAPAMDRAAIESPVRRGLTHKLRGRRGDARSAALAATAIDRVMLRQRVRQEVARHLRRATAPDQAEKRRRRQEISRSQLELRVREELRRILIPNRSRNVPTARDAPTIDRVALEARVRDLVLAELPGRGRRKTGSPEAAIDPAVLSKRIREVLASILKAPVRGREIRLTDEQIERILERHLPRRGVEPRGPLCRGKPYKDCPRRAPGGHLGSVGEHRRRVGAGRGRGRARAFADEVPAGSPHARCGASVREHCRHRPSGVLGASRGEAVPRGVRNVPLVLSAKMTLSEESPMPSSGVSEGYGPHVSVSQKLALA